MQTGTCFQGVIELGSVTDPVGFLDSLAEGKVYVNVHTALYPAGEIRGQLVPDAACIVR